MFKNDSKKVIGYIITSLVLPMAFSLIYSKVVDTSDSYTDILLLTIIFAVALVVMFIIFEIAKFLIKSKKSKTCLEVLQELDKIGNSIHFSGGKAMFDVLDKDYALYEAMNSRETWLQKRLKNSYHVVYHSTTAKSHLNWIEYVFWAYLGQVHKKIGCDVTISLHYDEKARESGLLNLKERERYNSLFKCYSNIAKVLIGSDITVIDEEESHHNRRYATYYTTMFHNRFVKGIVQYAKQIAEGQLDYKGFMRKISYIESTFPILVFSKYKMKRSRLYVLDREMAHEIWNNSPFVELKNDYGMFFINAQTIKYADGTPIRIFSPEETVNITDDMRRVQEELTNTEVETKKVMFELLSSSTPELATKYLFTTVTDENIDIVLMQIISDIKSNYKF